MSAFWGTLVLFIILNLDYFFIFLAAGALYKDKELAFRILVVLSLIAFIAIASLPSQINSLYTIDRDVYLNYKAPGEY